MVDRSHLGDPAGTLLAILNSSPLAIIAIDREGVVTLWNPAAENLLGWTAEEAIGRPLAIVPPEHAAAFRADLAAILAGASLPDREVRRVRKDGTLVDVTLSLAPLRQDGAITGVVAVAADIAPRRAAERERDATGRIAELALSRGRMVAGRVDTASGALEWTGEDRGVGFWEGHAPATIDELLDRVHPHDRDGILDAARSLEALVEIEFRVVRADGSTRWLSAHGLLADDGGLPQREGVVIDVTESRQREAELRATTETLRALIAASPLPVTASDIDGRVTLWSPAAEEMFGWTAEEAIGEPLPFVRDQDWPALQELRARVLAGEVVVDVETVRQRKDGSTLDASLSLAPITGPDGEVRGLIGIVSDVSERKRQLAELAELAEREGRTAQMLSAIVRASPSAIVALDEEFRVISWNPSAERIFGWSAEEVLGQPIPYIPPEREEEAARLRRRVLGGEVVTSVELQRLRKDGSRVDVEVSLAPLKNGAVYGLMAIAVDVSERVRAERALREAEERYRTLVEQLPAVVYIDDVSDATGRTLYVSPQVEQMFGITMDAWSEAHVDTWLQFVHPDDRAGYIAAYLRATQDLEPLDVEYRFGSGDHEVWVRDLGRVLPASQGRPAQLHGLVLDITELKETQTELERSIELLRASDAERRRLVSRLVLAQEEERRLIATDLHDDAVQAMTAVGLRLGLLRNLAAEGNAPAAEDFEKLESTVRAALGRLRRLLFELRPAELDRSGLAATLAIQLEQQQAEFGLAYRLENRLEWEPSPEARVIAYRLAREALANARAHARASVVVVELETRDGGVSSIVRDDGVGFDVESVLAAPRPSHLGLPAMRERAELAGGWVRITSEPGAGTTVEFWIPDPESGDGHDHEQARGT